MHAMRKKLGVVVMLDEMIDETGADSGVQKEQKKSTKHNKGRNL
jgi:hypothetical protein